MEIVWPCMISGPAYFVSCLLPESVTPDAKADSSVNMVIMRSMSTKRPNERHAHHFCTTLRGKGCNIYQRLSLDLSTLTFVSLPLLWNGSRIKMNHAPAKRNQPHAYPLIAIILILPHLLHCFATLSEFN